MMKVGLYGNQTEKTKAVMNTFDRLCQEGCFERDDVSPDVVITVGGDGTLLGAFHHYRTIRSYPFCGDPYWTLRILYRLAQLRSGSINRVVEARQRRACELSIARCECEI